VRWRWNVADSFYEKALDDSRPRARNGRQPTRKKTSRPRARADADLPPVKTEDLIQVINALADALAKPAICCPTCGRPYP
jgi:hypothetical protein